VVKFLKNMFTLTIYCSIIYLGDTLHLKEEVILQMILSWHSPQFRKIQTDIVFRRKGGNYGIIETDYDTH
jgi:hypothetical protein